MRSDAVPMVIKVQVVLPLQHMLLLQLPDARSTAAAALLLHIHTVDPAVLSDACLTTNSASAAAITETASYACTTLSSPCSCCSPNLVATKCYNMCCDAPECRQLCLHHCLRREAW
jgi:hypothetical protein